MTPTKFVVGSNLMAKMFLAGIGGFVGSILRYSVSGLVQDLSRSIDFPYGTLAVNLIGCLAIGFLSQLAESRGYFTAETRTLVFIGVLGGFTTFSTFAFETFELLRDGQFAWAALNIVGQVTAGMLGLWAGYVTAG